MLIKFYSNLDENVNLETHVYPLISSKIIIFVNSYLIANLSYVNLLQRPIIRVKQVRSRENPAPHLFLFINNNIPLEILQTN